METQGHARVRRIHSNSQYAAVAISAFVCGLSACGGGSSNKNPVPTISSLSPDHVTAGGSSFTLTVNGSNFISSSVVNWNDAARPTNFVNSGQLTASIGQSDIAAVGSAQVSVFNPAPAGGTSGHFTFSINSAGTGITLINLSTADLLYDATVGGNNWIYASVPGNAASGTANSITAINPATGRVLDTPAPVGIPDNPDPNPDPGRLALSDDGQFLYFGLNNAPAVRRLSLSGTPTLDPLRIPLGGQGSDLRAETLQVLQGEPNSIAVARKSSGTPRNAGVAAFDRDVQRKTATDAGSSPNVIQLCTAPSVLFGLNVGDGPPPAPGFSVLSVDPSGVTLTNRAQLSGIDISLGTIGAVERIFSTSGLVLDVAGLSVVHDFSLTGLVKADSMGGRVFYLVQNPAPAITTWTIHAFNLDTFAPMGTLDITGVNGIPSSLIRWGTNGLAFRTNSNQVFLITSSLVAGP